MTGLWNVVLGFDAGNRSAVVLDYGSTVGDPRGDDCWAALAAAFAPFAGRSACRACRQFTPRVVCIDTHSRVSPPWRFRGSFLSGVAAASARMGRLGGCPLAAKIETRFSNDPIFIGLSGEPRHLLLRIGAGEQGKSRSACLSISQARVVAYTLLAEAERIGASDKTS